MKRTYIKTILSAPTIGTELTVCGWVRTRRDSKGGFSFLEINDGSCFENLQIIADNNLTNYSQEVLKLFPGASVEVKGQLVASEGTGQSCEVKASSLKVFGFCNPEEYPLGKQKISFERLREIAHLRPRTNTFGAVNRFRNLLSKATHDFFQELGFYYIHTPIITSSDCEGAGEMFRVTTLTAEHGHKDFSEDFFKKRTGLTVSGQLSVENFACSMGNVYTFGPTFRAENSNTARHLAEFWMIEPEIAFADLDDDAVLAENYIKYMLKIVLEKGAGDLTFFNDRIDKGLIERLTNTYEKPFEKIEYTDAIRTLESSGENFQYKPHWGCDLQSEHERYLVEKKPGRPSIVVNYPKEIKSFYMKENSDGKTVAAMDILVPGIGELVGGSQREDDFDRLHARIVAGKMDPADYWWYSELRKYGTVPHAGFGLGFERMMLFVTGMSNIRDVIPFPRTPGHADF